MNTLKDRFIGALAGLACGDAVGTTVEFSPRGSFAPVTDMTGNGPFNLKAGQWTDDTSMALCLAESLVEKQAFDARDQMSRYLNWWQWGYLSATGSCFDIGNTVRDALARFRDTGEPYSGDTAAHTAGNGSLMRLAPVVLFAHPAPDHLRELAALSSRTTHGAAEAVECCELFALLLDRCLRGTDKASLMQNLADQHWQEAKVQALAGGDFLQAGYDDIIGSGYCIQSLEAALWCFFHTDNYRDAILAATNLGDDADTTAAITGQIAGAFYGASAIPEEWIDKLAMRDDIVTLATSLFERTHKIQTSAGLVLQS
ncbi:ADP-ribosyl-[dinitrogen reductase] hydrolase [Alcanivorax nanhaiticus]|uniref:ADP-ribosyl-[dinitrogen reductase] hydrolase n=1 Tax=Alcanivorax nanhaiticus TaxID=1177154 RepID=A0A095UNJ6_9GAMM|nr:ADP-ribosylglycohydrolase family protein [Alcanivorax nanhaiticus]KGD64065.1 ADP-ribosyl-[dinitrogen reductase] hydrolase [Alcanivorax nanhaiticus]